MSKSEAKPKAPNKKPTVEVPQGQALTPRKPKLRDPRDVWTPPSLKGSVFDPRRAIVPTSSVSPTRPLERVFALPEWSSSQASTHSAGVHLPVARPMELEWDDELQEPVRVPGDGLVERWVKRGDLLLRHLAEHGAARHEYRVDLDAGRFVWVDPEGHVSAEASVKVICSFSPTTSVVVMGWADPRVRAASVSRVDGMSREQDADPEGAWHIAMKAAECVGTDYLYCVARPDTWYFLSLSGLTFTPAFSSFTPSTPVRAVLQELSGVRSAIESGAEPAEALRERLVGLGSSFVHEADYVYRDTDWAVHLQRTGRRLVQLAGQCACAGIASASDGAIVAWFNLEQTAELVQAMVLLEREWALLV